MTSPFRNHNHSMNTTQRFAAVFLGALLTASPALALSTAVSASAGVSTGSTTVSANAQARVTTAKSRANQEITRRITILTQLNANVQTMVKVSAG